MLSNSSRMPSTIVHAHIYYYLLCFAVITRLNLETRYPRLVLVLCYYTMGGQGYPVMHTT